jgi:hypothetical protein
LAAWGEPSRPGLPPEGETGKGGFKFLAAAGDYRRGYPLKSHSAAHSHKSSQPLESRNSQLYRPLKALQTAVNRKLEALRRFCRWAHTTGKLCTNVAAGHETFRLRVVKSNTKAVAFYKRMGWRAEREFPHETLPTTMLEMVKTVPPPVITSSGVDLAYNTLE